MATWQMRRFMLSSILDLVGDRRDSRDRALRGAYERLGKEPMIKTILIT